VAEFRRFSNSGPWRFNTNRNSVKFPPFKAVEDPSWPQNANSWLTKQYSISTVTSYHSVRYDWWRRSCVQRPAAGQLVFVFQILLTANISAHEFVVLNVLLRAWQMVCGFERSATRMANGLWFWTFCYAHGKWFVVLKVLLRAWKMVCGFERCAARMANGLCFWTFCYAHGKWFMILNVLLRAWQMVCGFERSVARMTNGLWFWTFCCAHGKWFVVLNVLLRAWQMVCDFERSVTRMANGLWFWTFCCAHGKWFKCEKPCLLHTSCQKTVTSAINTVCLQFPILLTGQTFGTEK